MKQYTTDEKIKILEHNKWMCTEGYCLEFEAPENAQNVIISKEEIHEKLKEEPEWYCMTEYGDFFVDLDSAWEDLLDEIGCNLDTDEDEEIYKHIEKQLKELR